jgi:predicted DsbA family dithiol-disulfide isomerase
VTRASALIALRIATLAGLAASAALTVDYRSAGASFCGPNSGCAALRETDLAHLWGAGVTLPEVGLFGLSVLFALSSLRDATWAFRLSLVSGAIGLALLAIQAIDLKTFCWLCVTTDVSSAIGGGFGFLALRRSSGAGGRDPLRTGSWAALAALAIAAPMLWPKLKPSAPVPAQIRDFYQPGRVNVIEFADFECPFCRRLHDELKELLKPYGDRVNLVRLNVPLDRHPNARHAALASICAEPSGKSAALSDFLFSTDDLSKRAILAHAKRLGIDQAEFERCLDSPGPKARLERDRRILDDIGFEGLPTTYVGAVRIVGAQPREVFEDALENAARGGGERGVPAWAFVLAVLALAGAVVRFGWTSGASENESARP